MHGLGDNIHQRAVVRQLMERYDVYLKSSWVAPYHDLIPQGLKVMRRMTNLRTQTKNANGEAFYCGAVPPDPSTLTITYKPEQVRRLGTVLAAMCETCGVNYDRANFHLPVPLAWMQVVSRLIGDVNKPLMVYRPLVERTEWGGCPARNPDHAAYAELYRSIRERYFVVSIADLVPNVEWAVGEEVDVDLKFHAGELPFPLIAGLVRMAHLVYASPGFVVPLAQAVGTSVVCVFGGYESSRSFNTGHAPYLGIDTVEPCECFSPNHRCNKRIDITKARHDLHAFIASHRSYHD